MLITMIRFFGDAKIGGAYLVVVFVITWERGMFNPVDGRCNING